MNIFRRLPLPRLLLLLCGVALAVGIGATALALAADTGPKPPPKPLAQAVHDALSSTPVEGVSAHIQLTDHLLEGASLASGGEGTGGADQLLSSPLLTGASGRMWIAKDGRVRLELQAEKGDTQIFYDGQTVSIYDASSNTLYRYAIPAREERDALAKEDTEALDHATREPGSRLGVAQPEIQRDSPDHHDEVPTVAKIEEAISHLEHVNVSEAKPDDVAGQAAYTVRVSPKESGSLLGAGELSWDAVHGVPLRAAIYSSDSPSSPTIELAATEISYGPVDSSVFAFTAPPGAKIEDLNTSTSKPDSSGHSADQESKPKLTSHGNGISTVGVLESKTQSSGTSGNSTLEGLQKVKIGGVEANELPTALGTLLSFERSGVRYLLLGAVSPSTVETVAKGL